MTNVAVLHGLAGPLTEYAMWLTQITLTQVRRSPYLLMRRYPRKSRARARGALVDQAVPVAAGVMPTTAMRHIPRNAHAPIVLHPCLLRKAVLQAMAARTQRTWTGLRKV